MLRANERRLRGRRGAERLHARRAGLALLCGSILGCASLGLDGPLRPPSFEEAEDRASELHLLPPTTDRPMGAAAIRLWARVENPNPVSLTLSEIEGRLFLGDAGVDVDLPLGLPLVAEADTVIPIDVSVGLGEVPRLAETALGALSTGSLGYRLRGTVGIDAGLLGRPRFGPFTLLEGTLEVFH